MRQWSQSYGRLGQTTAGQSLGRAQHCQLATPPSDVHDRAARAGPRRCHPQRRPHLPSKPRHRVGECYSEPRLALRELIRGLAEATTMPPRSLAIEVEVEISPRTRPGRTEDRIPLTQPRQNTVNTLATTRPRCLAAAALVG